MAPTLRMPTVWPTGHLPQPKGAGWAEGLPCHSAQEGQRVSEEGHSLPPTASGEEKVNKEKAAGWKRCQREGNQYRRGTKRNRAGASLGGGCSGSRARGPRGSRALPALRGSPEAEGE